MPVRINSSWRLASLPTSSVMRSRSRATICEVLATESLGRPVAFAVSSTLPGASAQTRLLVNGTQTTVRIRLRLSASPRTTITGLRNPGPEPVGSGKSAQYTCPWETTIRRLRGCVARRLPMLGQASYQPSRKHGSSLRLRPQDRAARYIRLRLPYKPGFVTSSAGDRAAQHHGKFCREWRSPFSYPEYNWVPECVQVTWPKEDGTIRCQKSAVRDQWSEIGGQIS
jgi:hypothetical protein